jgi:hypothetical protein
MDTIIYDIGETLRTCSECHVTDEDRHYIAGPRVLCTRCAGNLERSETPRAAAKPRVEYGRYAIMSAVRNTPTRRNERVERRRP